jgi:hypothetical protein
MGATPHAAEAHITAADSACMFRWLPLALVACTPSLSVGYETHTRLSGPMATMMVDDTRSVSADVGGNFNKRVGLTLGARVHDTNFSAVPRYMFASTSIDVRYRPLVLKHLIGELHVGPAGGVMFDSGMLDYDIGQGVRYGVMIAAKLGPVAAYADLYQTKLVFEDGAAKGVSTLTGLTVGLSLR